MQPDPAPQPHRRWRPVAVTALGVVGPLGFGPAETAAALRAGRDRIVPITAFDVGGCRSRTGGVVDLGRLDRWLADHPGPAPRAVDALHPASKMLVVAARQIAMADPGFAADAMVLGTTGGGMTFGEAFYRLARRGERRRQIGRWLANYSPQKMALDATVALGARVPAQIVANACASGTNAIGHAFCLIRSGQRRRVLCGGYDALSELVFVGFDSLRASTPEKCRPFDRDRSGLVIGEGAALLALEDFAGARRRGAPILGAIVGYGVSTDTHHLTQPHPSGVGPRRAMTRALAAAGLPAAAIDYINAHGTATPLNDASEGAALSALFPGRPVSSTKALMGHALGAAGAIEAVFCLLALEGQFVPPNINFRHPDPEFGFEVVTAPRPAALRTAMSNSFGFGGSNAAIILARPAAGDEEVSAAAAAGRPATRGPDARP